MGDGAIRTGGIDLLYVEWLADLSYARKKVRTFDPGDQSPESFRVFLS